MNQAAPIRIGRYELVTLLGQGGMARVYLAVSRGPVGFNKLVVVKQVRPELAWDQEFITMFFDEARIAARLNHPNVVGTYEILQEGEQYLLVMEYLEGHSLAELLQRVGRLRVPIEEHLWILTQVLAGLHYGHEARDYDGKPLGIVHRDVSPSNVFLTYNGDVKLLDFGIAKSAGAASATGKGTVKGKLGYGAPEQFLGKSVDARTDVFAVGIMLWEALAGKRRKQADTPASTMQARVGGFEPKIREVRPDVPPPLARICDRATAIEPEARYPTALAFQQDVERYLESCRRRVGRREVASLVCAHFSAERLAIRKRIEDQLSGTLDALPAVEDRAPEPDSLPPRASSTPNLRPGFFEGLTPHKPVLAAVGGLIALGALALVLSQSNTRPPPEVKQSVMASPSWEAAPAPSLVAAPPRPAEQIARADNVQLSIRAAPAHATLTVDGRPVNSNPYQAEVPRDHLTHVVQVSAPGYQPAERTITFAQDLDMAIELRETRVPRSRARRSAEAPRERPAAADNAVEPGMELLKPAEVNRPSRRQLDEKDPYAR